MNKPVEMLNDTSIYDLYRWHGIVPDALLHLSGDVLGDAMLDYTNSGVKTPVDWDYYRKNGIVRTI